MATAAFLTALLGVAMVALGAGAGVLARSADDDVSLAASVTAMTFVGVGAVLLAWAGGNAAAGLALRRRRAWARRLTLLMGALNLLVLPVGTALAAYAFWVLLNDQARRFFAAGDAAAG